MLRQVMRQMDGLAASPTPSPGLVDAALGAAPGSASQVVVTSFSGGRGVCGESVSYTYPGNGAAPLVSVRRIGDGCGRPLPGSPVCRPRSRVRPHRTSRRRPPRSRGPPK